MNKQKIKILIESLVHEIIEDNTDPFKYLPNIINDFAKYSKTETGFDKPFKVILKKDKNNAKKLLGKTGYYDPSDKTIVLYVSGRHPKDILRTLSHELIHHAQNCQNKFMPSTTNESSNVKDNEQIKELEKEAYEKGNIVFREWEEKLKENNLNYLDEFNAMGTGAVVGFMAPLGMDMGPVHKIMNSGDEPIKKRKKRTNESIEKPEGVGQSPLYQDDQKGIEKIHNEMESGDEEPPLEEEYLGINGGVRYFQMGGGIKNKKFYNKDMKTGKATKNPGVPNLKK